MLVSVQYAITTPNVYTPIPAQPDAPTLLSAISTAMQKSGWLLVGTLPLGVRFLGESPQGYSVFLDLQTQSVPGHGQCVTWQLNSAVSTGAVGPLGASKFDVTYAYQLVAFPCGFFFSRPGEDTYAVCGGIPYSPYAAEIGPPPAPPALCNMGDAPPPSEIWWFFAELDGTGGSENVKHPRQTLDQDYGATTEGPGGAPVSCGCQSGVVTLGNNQLGDPQILRWSSTWNERFSGLSPIDSQPIWYNGDDFLYPAFIAWGHADDEPITIRGQLYNAVCRSGEYAADLVHSWDSYIWMCYTDEYFFGSLWVFLGGLGTGNWSW
jgi:hypothetical protein